MAICAFIIRLLPLLAILGFLSSAVVAPSYAMMDMPIGAKSVNKSETNLPANASIPMAGMIHCPAMGKPVLNPPLPDCSHRNCPMAMVCGAQIALPILAFEVVAPTASKLLARIFYDRDLQFSRLQDGPPTRPPRA